MFNFFSSKKREEARLRAGIHEVLNDIEVKVKKNRVKLNDVEKKNFEEIDFIANLVAKVKPQALPKIYELLTSVQNMFEMDAAKNSIAPFFEATNMIFTEQNMNLSGQVALGVLQKRVERMEERRLQLNMEINAAGGIQAANRQQKHEWAVLTNGIKTLNSMMEIIIIGIDREAAIENLENLMSQLAAISPKYKKEPIPKNITAEELRRMTLKYRATLEKEMDVTDAFTGMVDDIYETTEKDFTMEGFDTTVGATAAPATAKKAPVMEGFNPTLGATNATVAQAPVATQTPVMAQAPAVQNNGYVNAAPKTVQTAPQTPQSVNPEEELRQAENAKRDLQRAIQQCDAEARKNTAELMENERYLKMLITQLRALNPQSSDAEAKKQEIYSFNLTRRRLQQTIEAWTAKKNVYHNKLVVVESYIEGRKLNAVEAQFESIQVPSIEDMAMEVRADIEKLNEQSEGAIAAANVALGGEINSAYSEDSLAPVQRTSILSDASIDALERELLGY